jgi:glycosyltransferase involved in cell wall biosynthesis
VKLLILTQYYPPETGAPQNRLSELAIRLKKKGVDVCVLTAMPNYPKGQIFESYQGKWFMKEEIKGIPVFRSWIYASQKKGIVHRLLNYFSFVFSSAIFGLKNLGKVDFVLCESPPLFLGLAALWLCFLKRSKLIFNVSDLWPESAEKLGIVSNKILLGWATFLENYLYRKSALISGQTQGIVEDIRRRHPQKRFVWLRNGVDTSFFNPDQVDGRRWRTENGFSQDDFLFLYAGILGHAQGLEVILKAASRLKEFPQLKFLLVGTGPERDMLENLDRSLGNSNVFFIGSVEKEQMPEIVAASSATVVPLKKLDLFLGAIPSKIFENLAMRKPVFLGVDGEARTLFIDEGKAGWYFEPENDADLALKIKEVMANPDLLNQKGNNGLAYVKAKFEREMIADEFLQELKKIVT